MPLLRATWAALSAARPAAHGVLLRAPLIPGTVPADAHEIVSPLGSVMVMIVLLNVALMWAMPRVTPLRTFFFAAALPPLSAMCQIPSGAMDPPALRPYPSLALVMSDQ